MIQLVLIFISILFGFLYSLLSRKIKNIIIYSFVTLLFVFGYVFIIYKLYNGNVSLILKISLIVGYIMCKVLVNKSKLLLK